MPLSTDIKLPRSQPPVFPDECVVCRRESPGTELVVSTHNGWWLFHYLPWNWGANWLRVPACPGCAWRLRLLRWMGLIVMVSTAIAVVTFGHDIVKQHVPRNMRKWATIGIWLLVMAPLWTWRLFHPLPFYVSADDDSIDYEFADAEQAVEFARLNGVVLEPADDASADDAEDDA